MRTTTSRLLLGLLLLAGARTAAAENWAPLSEDGIEMEVDLDSLSNGVGTIRMAKDGLERTLGRLSARVAATDQKLRGVDLPAEMTGAPARLFAEAEGLARAMGPSLRLFAPPTTGSTIDSFAFHDGARAVKIHVSDPAATNLMPLVTLTLSKKVDGKWVQERQSHVQIDPEQSARYSVDRYDVDGKRTTETHREYYPMKRKGQWFGTEQDAGRGRHVLRTRDQRSGKLTTSVVRGAKAERLYILATGRAYRTPLPAAHPDFDPQLRTSDDIPLATLRQAGLHVVVDRSGRVSLRRGKGRAVDRAVLHKRGVTYVAPSGRRNAHLRHTPIKAKAR